MEAPIRKLDQSKAEAVVFLGKVGLGISSEHLQTAEYQKYDGIFLILDDEDIYDGETMPVEESLCVRLCFRGSHAEAPEHYAATIANSRRKYWYISNNKAVILSNIITGNIDLLTLAAACIGVTALIFAAKGNVWSIE